MPYRVAEAGVRSGNASIPDHVDRGEASSIIKALAVDPFRFAGAAQPHVEHGMAWTVYRVLLSSGRGFVSYSPFFTGEGELVVRLWPVVWADV